MTSVDEAHGQGRLGDRHAYGPEPELDGARRAEDRPGRLACRRLHAVGHFHLDPLWLWDKSDGLERFRATVRAVLGLMDRNAELTVAASSAALYAYLQRVDGDLFERVAAYVAAGRWEPVGGMWVEPDEHVPGGESYIRQLLLGQEFFARSLGRTAQVAWSPDSFGRYAQLPRMLVGSGLEAFIFKRPERSQKPLPEVFWWTAEDGSRVLTYHIHEYVTWGTSLPRLVRRVARDLREPLREGLLLYGVGNHGGGPTQANFDELRRLQGDTTLPPIEFSTPSAFFRRLLESGAPFPEVGDHLDYFSGGGYHAHARLKRAFRQTENLVLAAEAAAAVRTATRGDAYPAEALQRAWRQLAFNQFHDTAAGTCIPEVYPAVLDELAEARSIARDVSLEALHALADDIDIPFTEGGQPLVVFNPNGHAVRQFIVANVQLSELPPALGDPTRSHRLIDVDGRELPVQLVRETAMPANRIGFIAEAPALGYTTFRLVPRSDEAPPALEELPADDFGLENDRYRVTLDPATGTIASLYDKAHEIEVFNGPAAAPVIVADPGNAWGPRRFDRPRDDLVFTPRSFRRTQHGSLMSAIQVRYELEREGYPENVPTSSTLLQEFRIYRGIDHIDVQVKLDWHEQGCALKLAFPVFVRQYAEVTAEIPHGTTLYPIDGVEVPGLSWVDVTGESDFTASRIRLWHGVTIANDAKYSYSFAGDEENRKTIYIMVARGNAFTFSDEHAADLPDIAYEDEGLQEFTYSIVPHIEGWRDVGTDRRAIELNRPLTIITESAHPGNLPPAASMLAVSHHNVVLAALKAAESGDAVIARFYEAHGEATAGVRITCLGATIAADFAPREIKTFRISLDGTGPIFETDLLERTGSE